MIVKNFFVRGGGDVDILFEFCKVLSVWVCHFFILANLFTKFLRKKTDKGVHL
jgi:hypothetical protein